LTVYEAEPIGPIILFVMAFIAGENLLHLREGGRWANPGR